MSHCHELEGLINPEIEDDGCILGPMSHCNPLKTKLIDMNSKGLMAPFYCHILKRQKLKKCVENQMVQQKTKIPFILEERSARVLAEEAYINNGTTHRPR